MTKLIASAAALVTLSLPAAVSAQDTTPPGISKAAFRASLDSAPVRAIDSKDIEKRFAGQGSSPLLKTLYGSLAALNVIDVVSSRKALARGGVERNPLMKDAINDNMLAYGIKAATTAGTVLMIEKMAKRNRKAAIVSAFIANGVTALVVANNLRQGR